MDAEKGGGVMRQALMHAMALVCLVCGLVLSFNGSAASATATYGAAAVCLLFAYLPELEWFKAMGVEAKMKQTIDDVTAATKEAERVIERLRAISLPLAEMSFSMLARFGRYGGGTLPRRQRYELMKSIDSELVKLGAKPEQIEEVKQDFHRYNVFDLAHPVLSDLRKVMREVVATTQQLSTQIGQHVEAGSAEEERRVMRIREAERHSQMIGRWCHSVPPDYRAVHGQIMSMIRGSVVLNEEEQRQFIESHGEALSDLEYYGKHGEHHRPEKWVTEDKHAGE